MAGMREEDKSTGNLHLNEETHTMYDGDRAIFAPSVSTIIGIIYPFDLSDWTKEIMAQNGWNWFQAKAFTDKILKKAQQKGTCIHYQIEEYIKTGKEVGCQCPVFYPDDYDKPIKSHHDVQFAKWLKWYNKYNKTYPGSTWGSEIAYANPEQTWTGVQDVLTVRPDGIDWGDWKTTADNNKDHEIQQIISYRFLATHTFRFAKNERFYVFNTNPSCDDFYFFEDWRVLEGLSDAVYALKTWNSWTLKERIQFMRPEWDEQKVNEKASELEKEGNDLTIHYDPEAEKNIQPGRYLENHHINPDWKNPLLELQKKLDLPKEIGNQIVHLNREIESKKSEVNKVQEKNQKTQAKIDKLKATKADIELQISEVQEIIKVNDSVENKVKLSSLEDQLKATKADINNLTSQIAVKLWASDDTNAEISEAETRLKNLQAAKLKAFNELKGQNLEAQIQEIKDKIYPESKMTINKQGKYVFAK